MSGISTIFRRLGRARTVEEHLEVLQELRDELAPRCTSEELALLDAEHAEVRRLLTPHAGKEVDRAPAGDR